MLSEEDEWKQGVGTTYRVRATLRMGDVHVSFRFLPTGNSSKSAKSAKPGLTLAISASWSTSDLGAHWSDEPGRPLERQLTEIARGLLTYAEQSLREGAQHRYDWQVQEQVRRQREEQERVRAAEARHEAQIAHQAQLRRQGLYQLVARRDRSQAIRQLVIDMRARHERAKGDPQFEAWCAFALHEAEAIDPLLAPLGQVMEQADAPAEDDSPDSRGRITGDHCRRP